MTRFTLVSLALVASVAAPSGAQQKPTAPFNDSIRGSEMVADIGFLASELLKGRPTLSPEVQVAAEFVKARFERLGLKPVGPGGSYNQPFNMMRVTMGEGNRLDVTLARQTGFTRALNAGQEYFPQRFSATGTARGQVVFVGFGIRPEDYGEAVRGKIALALDHEPGERDPDSPFDGLVTSVAADPMRKTWLAQQAGAVGILFVEDVHNHPGARNFEAAFLGAWPASPPRIERLTLADWTDRVTIPAAQISVPLAEQLAGLTSEAFVQLSAGAEKVAAPRPLDASVTLTASIARHPFPTRNIVGLLEGSDATLKDEWIVICGHHDHNGADGGGFQPGADDDASGVAAVIDIAEAYVMAARQGRRPKRSILFASWDAEERGLLGAWAYTERPLAPLAKTVAVLNLDMISRNEETPPGSDPRFRGIAAQTSAENAHTLNVLGHTRFPWLLAEIEKANAPFGLGLKTVLDNNVSQLLRRSDHWPFMQVGVPAIWFLTGLNPDYHTYYDRVERLNVGKMERIARMVHQLSWTLAEQGAPPRTR